MRLAGIALVFAAAALATAQRSVLPASGPATKVEGRAVDTAWSFPRICRSAEAPRGGPSSRPSGGGFPGIGSSGQFPANCGVAVGPEVVVQVVNGQIAFISKLGAQTYGQPATAFFAGLAQTPNLDQPRACFDRSSGRFVVVFLESDPAGEVSNFLLAVSDDDDPHGVWFQYRISAIGTSGANEFWSKRPSLGVNSDGVVIATTLTAFSTGNLGGSLFTMFPKQPMLSGSPLTVTKTLDTASPHVHVGETVATAVPYVFGVAKTASNKLRLYRVRNTGTVTPQVNFVDQTTVSVPAPPNTVPSTDGGSMQTGTDQVSTVVAHGDRVFVALNVLNGTTMSGVRWFVYNVSGFASGTVTTVGSGLSLSASGSHFVPAAGVNVHGDFGLLFSGSGALATSDVMTSGRTSGDPFAFLSAPVVAGVATGSPYADTRWGGYFGVGADGWDAETFWGTAMVVREDGSWGTQIVNWTVTKTWPIAPSDASWVRGAWVGGGLASLAADDDDYFVARAGWVPSPGEPPAQLVVEGTAPTGEVLGLTFELVARVNTTGLAQQIELWDWSSGLYVSAGTQAATVAESLQSVAASGDLARFVQSKTGAVRARVSWFQVGPVIVWPWTASVDQVVWRIRVR